MKDVMVDLETWGNGSDALVVQIGAVYFNRETGELGKDFKININAEDAVKSGAKIEPGTVYWWLRQEGKAQDSITTGQLYGEKYAFVKLNEFLENAECIWSHATFDFPIMTSAMKRLDIKPSFLFKAARDIRTLLDMAQFSFHNVPRDGVHHDGLDDAKYQVKYCVMAMKKLRMK